MDRVRAERGSDGRLQQLDVLRVVAVGLVVGHHWAQFVSKEGFLPSLFARIGWVGVDLFFVLSGFLVSGLLFKEHQRHGEIRVFRFYVRRGLKIYPPFYAFLFVCLALFPRPFGPQTWPWVRVAAECLFVQNYVGGIWNHTWSLGVEEHFYLLLGILAAVASRRGWLTGNVRKAARFTLVVGLVCLALRCWVALRPTYSWFRMYAPTHLRLDALLFGVFLSYVHHHARPELSAFVQRWRRLLLPASVALLAAAWVPQQNAFTHTLGLTCLTLGFGGCLLLLLPSGDGRALGEGSRWMNAASYLGQHSYSVYLWHMPVLLYTPWVYRRFTGVELAYGPRLVLYVVGSFAVGIGMAKLVELPALRFRDRIFPSRSARSCAPPAPVMSVGAWPPSA